MRAMMVIKLLVLVAGAVIIGMIGYAAGQASVEGQVDKAQVEQLNSCLPINDTDELAKCMGLEIVGGQ